MGRGETSQAVGVLAQSPGQTEEERISQGKTKEAELSPGDVMAEIRRLRTEVGRLRLAYGLSIGLALVLVGLSFLVYSEFQAEIFGTLFVLAGIFAALYPYFLFRSDGKRQRSNVEGRYNGT